MASKPHREIRLARTTSRKFKGRCEDCGKSICSCKAYQYVDENNAAISNSAPYLCRSCYERRYNVKLPTEIDAYKEKLLNFLARYAAILNDEEKADFVYRVMRVIENTD